MSQTLRELINKTNLNRINLHVVAYDGAEGFITDYPSAEALEAERLDHFVEVTADHSMKDSKPVVKVKLLKNRKEK
ncbi:hypothetical protein IJJ08_03770 [bacterium]|nr:hypothetical protein [bacterium]